MLQPTLLALLTLTLTPLIIIATPSAITASTMTITQSSSTPTGSAVVIVDPSYTNSDTFQNDMISAHNFYRAQHNASALAWNTTSASYAQNWSGACEFVHSGGPTGENLVAGAANATASVDIWGQERNSYNFNDGGFSEQTGHFTQLVWRNTTTVGCGRTSCQGKDGTPGVYVVCEYFPPGNVVGDGGAAFKYNVLPLVKGDGKLTDTVESGVSKSEGGRVRGGGLGMGMMMVMVVVVVGVLVGL